MKYTTGTSVVVTMVLPAGRVVNYSANNLHLAVRVLGTKKTVNGATVVPSSITTAGSISFTVPCTTDGMYYCTFVHADAADQDTGTVTYTDLGRVTFSKVTATSVVVL